MVSYMKRAIEIKNVIYSLFKRKIEKKQEKKYIKKRTKKRAKEKLGAGKADFLSFRQFLERLFSHFDNFWNDFFHMMPTSFFLMFLTRRETQARETESSLAI